ncbi:MAG: hypothetical protein WA945_11440 [Arcobacteraceae bacterium]
MSTLSPSFKECLDRAKKEFDDIERSLYEKRKLKLENIKQRPTRNIEICFLDGIKSIEVKNDGKS